MTIREQIENYTEYHMLSELMKNVFLKDEKDAEAFVDYMEKCYSGATTFLAKTVEVVGSMMNDLFDQDRDLAISAVENYIDTPQYKTNLALCSLTVPKEKYIYAVLTDLGRAGVIIQVAKEKFFDDYNDYPGYIPESFTKELEEKGFECQTDGVFKTTMTSDMAEDILDGVASFNNDLQEKIIENGDYLKIDLDPVKEPEKKKKEEVKEEKEAEDESDDASDFFGFSKKKSDASVAAALGSLMGGSMIEDDEESEDEEESDDFDVDDLDDKSETPKKTSKPDPAIDLMKLLKEAELRAKDKKKTAKSSPKKEDIEDGLEEINTSDIDINEEIDENNHSDNFDLNIKL